MAFRLLISGARACFRRIECVTDWISYDVITPAAARAICEAVHWTPSIRWEIDEIRVLKPIRIDWMPTNTNSRMSINVDGQMERAVGGNANINYLVDVAYLVTARFELTKVADDRETAAQHSAMFRRRLGRRQFFRQPFLGIRSFPADVCEICKGDEPLGANQLHGTMDLGWMLYDIRYHEDQRPRFYRATMVDGVIDLRRRDALILAG